MADVLYNEDDFKDAPPEEIKESNKDGSYLAIVGRVGVAEDKSQKKYKYIELILLQKVVGEKTFKILDVKMNEETHLLETKQYIETDPYNMVYTIRFWDDMSQMTSGGRWVVNNLKLAVAKACGFFNKETSMVEFAKLPSCIGNMITFNITSSVSKKDNKTYSNPDAGSFADLASKMSKESLIDFYKKYDKMMAPNANAEEVAPPPKDLPF